jgi:cytidine deaminase
MEATSRAIQTLLGLAKSAAERAYCPYSGFPVGAAVQVDDGTAFVGANVENASFGLTICAERVAMAAAAAAGHRHLLAVVIYTPTDSPTPPCGACRQFLAEFGPAAEVFSFSRGEAVLKATVQDLLPGAFAAADFAAQAGGNAPK